VYTQWGKKSCSGGGSKLYKGFMAASHYNHKGGGANTLCMHGTPQYPSGHSNGNQDGNLLYGMEYQNTGAIDANHDKDAACVVCEHSSAATVYTQWGRTSCSNEFTNAARGKPTSQSSKSHGGHSSRAVDGNARTDWGGNSCTHTKTQNNPWWRVDLQKDMKIKKVQVTNRG
jgi:hypothetical protein